MWSRGSQRANTGKRELDNTSATSSLIKKVQSSKPKISIVREMAIAERGQKSELHLFPTATPYFCVPPRRIYWFWFQVGNPPAEADLVNWAHHHSNVTVPDDVINKLDPKACMVTFVFSCNVAGREDIVWSVWSALMVFDLTIARLTPLNSLTLKCVHGWFSWAFVAQANDQDHRFRSNVYIQ